MLKKKIGVIGCGNMGEALISRLSSIVPRGRLIVNDADAARKNRMRRRYKVLAADENGVLAERSDVIILAVKPKDFEGLLRQIKRSLSKDKLLISIAAGITTKYIERSIGIGVGVVRVMPNMPAVIGEAISAVSAGSFAKRSDLKIAKAIFSSIGSVIEADEKMLDAVTALSGSGPAYFFYLIESLIEAGMELGLDEKTVTRLVVKTALGSAKLLEVAKKGPHDLRTKVASKGGTTEAALKIFESEDFKGIIKEAVKRACGRAKELSRS